MKRRHFITSIAVAITHTKLFGATGLIRNKEAKNNISYNGKSSSVITDSIYLPQSPKPFEDVIVIDVNSPKALAPITAQGVKVMGSHSPFKVTESKQYVIQYTGEDLGWILM